MYILCVDSCNFYISDPSKLTGFLKNNRCIIKYCKDAIQSLYVDADLDSIKHIVSWLRGYGLNIEQIDDYLKSKILHDAVDFQIDDLVAFLTDNLDRGLDRRVHTTHKEQHEHSDDYNLDVQEDETNILDCMNITLTEEERAIVDKEIEQERQRIKEMLNAMRNTNANHHIHDESLLTYNIDDIVNKINGIETDNNGENIDPFNMINVISTDPRIVEHFKKIQIIESYDSDSDDSDNPDFQSLKNMSEINDVVYVDVNN